MDKQEPLKEDALKSSEPEAPTGLPSEDRKKVMIGSVLGGGMFLGLLIALIVLVSGETPTPHPVPPKPKPKNITNNPYVWLDNSIQDERTRVVLLFNNRTEIEKNVTNTTNGLKVGPPKVRNTTENWEPIYIKVSFKQMDEHLLNVRYTDPEAPRWEVPVYANEKDYYYDTSDVILPTPIDPVIFRDDHRFEWYFIGKAGHAMGSPIITTKDCRLQFFDKYIEFEAVVQTDFIFGMGERVDTFHLRNDNYSLWNKDYPYEFGEDSETGTYGSHPFLLNRLKDKQDFLGLFMRNSNAMLFSFWHSINGTYINYKMVGGIIDLYVFHASDAEYIVKKYHTIIGRPYLPPIWAMGLQQARRGYKLADLKAVVKGYTDAKIPIDAVWADIDLNVNYKTFTVDPNTYAGLKEWVQQLHDPKEGIDMHFVAIANPILKKESGYKYYDEATKENLIIKSALHFDQQFVGRTFAGDTVWLDFFQYNTVLLWSTGLHDLHELSLFDGIWISENEPNQVCDGECMTGKTTYADGDKPQIPNPFHNASEFDYLQYRPTLNPLERSTLPMAAYECCDDMFYKQFNTHNLYGLQSAKATFDSIHAIFEDKRFLVVSRSTFPGSGMYGSHWTGDNYGTWESMIGSIPAILNFNIFGIPHVGAAIGGFYGNCSGELLVRWYELGCFYPLMLSYTNSNSNQKEAYFDEATKALLQVAIMERYRYIRWMYTQMFEAFMWGGAVVHPLFFAFPDDEETYKKEITDRTFMWAKTLYVIPALVSRQVRNKAYLPNWRWYDLRTMQMVQDYRKGQSGEYFYFEQPLGQITVLVRGGSVVVYQRSANEARIMNVEDLNKIPILIVVAPDHDGKAQGTMISDSEGLMPHPDPMSNTYRHYAFTYMNQIFRINKLAGFDFHSEYEFDYFYELFIFDVYGFRQIDYVCMMDTSMHRKELQFRPVPGTNAIEIYDHRMAKMGMFNLETVVWGANDQHNFCEFGVHLESYTYLEEGKTIEGELATSDPEDYQLKFDFKASVITDHIISMTITMVDHNHVPWVVPDVVDEVIRKQRHGTKIIDNCGLRFSPPGKPFAFDVSDPADTHDFIITTKNLPFVYVKNYMHIKAMANSRHIFGLGERLDKFELRDGIYSLWNYDNMIEETGKPPGNNLYGSHMFYLMHLHDPRMWAGVFFLNSNPIDVKIQHVGMQTVIDHMFIGGIIDAFFFQKARVDEVLRNYHMVIGHPIPIPYWAFGYHQSRWGYKDIEHLRDVVNKFEMNSLPLDGLWMDKDYMDHMRSFTINENKWYGLKNFVKELHDKGKHFIMLIDPGIAIDPKYSVYSEGLSRGVFLQGAVPDEPLKGVTWPGYSVWIDFLAPSADKFWEDQLMNFYEKIDFDGIWLDMNEPSNFCDGECPDETNYYYYYFPLDFYDDLYYNPTHVALEDSTLSMEAKHHGSNPNAVEFNYHNLYCLYQSRITARFFTDKLHKRPFVVSSGTFPGIGRYAFHWLGDNYASWHYLEYSIAGVFNFGMFGIPFVGPDICGYEGNTTINLCSRWMQLGAFYPFMRNHNGPGHAPQEPYIDEKLMKVSQRAIRLRYTLARYIYSEYMHSALRGGTIFKPVLFEFPTDVNLYSILDTTLMFGNYVRITPVLEDGVSVLTSYFNNWDWFEFPSFKKVLSYNHTAKTGQNLTLVCDLEGANINAHIRAGAILPYQAEPLTDTSITTIIKMPSKKIQLIVIPDHTEKAHGNIFYDDEEHPENFRTQHHDYNVTLEGRQMNVKLVSGDAKWLYTKDDQKVTEILILNAQYYKDTICAKAFKNNGDGIALGYQYDAVQERMSIKPTTGDLEFGDLSRVIWSNSTCQISLNPDLTQVML